MPRTGNRTDLLTPGPTGPAPPGQPNGQAVMTPTGLPYGENQQLQQAQQAVPVAGAPPSAPPPPQNPIEAAKNFQMPALGDLHGPSERPNEPLQSGLPVGPGPSPPTQTGGIGPMLARMSSAVNSPALAQLAARANSLQQ